MATSKPRIELQSFDGNSLPKDSDSEYSELRTQRSQFAPKIDLGVKRNFQRNDTSMFIKELKDKGSLYSKSEFGDFKEDPTDRQILYRVSKKIYAPDEIKTIRNYVLKNRKGKTKKFFHFWTSFLMILLIFLMCCVLLFRIVEQWTSTYEQNLVSVSIQNPTINNFVSTISVIRYFLYNNESGDIHYINGIAAIQGSTAYTSISSICGNDKAYWDEEDPILRIKDSTDNGFKLAYDLLFILVMFAWMGYIIMRTFRKLKIHRIPLVIRSNNISPWSYKQRFKLGAFAIFLIISSFFTRYNMYDYSEKWLYCYDDISWDTIDGINHASQTLGLCILFPFLILLLLQQFNERLKYTMVPLILVNCLFMFVVVILAIYSYAIFFYYSAYFILRILHVFNIITALSMFVIIWVVDRYMSSEFDFYEEH